MAILKALVKTEYTGKFSDQLDSLIWVSSLFFIVLDRSMLNPHHKRLNYHHLARQEKYCYDDDFF